MSKLPKNNFCRGVYWFFVLWGFIGIPYISCENGVEEPVIITTFPVEEGGIIYGDWMPIKIGFSDAMAEVDAVYLAETVRVWDHNHVPVAGTVFWEDNTISFLPLEKWKPLEKYTCRISGAFFALDGRVASIAASLVFYVVTDMETPSKPLSPPEVTEMLLWKKTGDGDYVEWNYDADEYWNNVIEGECRLEIYFDREMDLSEPKRNLRMEPYRSYDVTAIDAKTLAVCFKAEVGPVKKITFTVKEDMRALSGEELKQDYVFDFTEWESDFKVSQIMILSSAEFYENENNELPMDDLGKIFQVGAENYARLKTRILDFTYQFNYPIDLASSMSALSKIELVPADGRIKNVPSLLEVGLFSPDFDQTWADMEFGPLENPYRYLLKIPGGMDGINDGSGHYMKEDITLKLDVVDWDLIDPMNQD
jgi:hypothetical protein